MIQIKNGKIEKYKLPSTGALEYEHPEHRFEKGQTVSGYNNLPNEVLLNEGWLPLEDNPPEYNIDTQYIVPTGYDILFDKVERIYEVKELADLPVSNEQKMDSLLKAMQGLIRVDELIEEELAQIIYIYPEYNIGKLYKTNDVFQYQGKLYKVIQEHTSQADWIPSEVPALYLNMLPDNIIPEWVQPAGAHDAYSTGDQVIFENKVYESLIDGNAWSPTAYPAGWKLAE